MGLLILLLAYLFQDQVVVPILMDCFFPFPVMGDTQIYLEPVDFTVSPVGPKIYVMVLYQLFSIVSFQEHAEIALLAALVLKDALLFLCPSHTQLSTMTGSSYLDLKKQAENPLFWMSSRHSSMVSLKMIIGVGCPVFPSKSRTT